MRYKFVRLAKGKLFGAIIYLFIRHDGWSYLNLESNSAHLYMDTFFFFSRLWGWLLLLLLCFFFFFSLTRHDFCLRHDFYFLINWLIAFFFFGSFFCFNWPSFFNKGIWVNLCKLTYSIPPLFSLPIKKKNERN